MANVKGQQHQKGSKALSKKKAGNGDGGNRKSAGMSAKQEKQRKYAAQAGMKFKTKTNGGGSPHVDSTTPFAGDVPRPDYVCRCGQCLPCLRKKGMQERSLTFFSSLLYG